jgi:hypothetical protein
VGTGDPQGAKGLQAGEGTPLPEPLLPPHPGVCSIVSAERPPDFKERHHPGPGFGMSSVSISG